MLKNLAYFLSLLDRETVQVSLAGIRDVVEGGPTSVEVQFPSPSGSEQILDLMESLPDLGGLRAEVADLAARLAEPWISPEPDQGPSL